MGKHEIARIDASAEHDRMMYDYLNTLPETLRVEAASALTMSEGPEIAVIGHVIDSLQRL
jgi:hypothetical protein